MNNLLCKKTNELTKKKKKGFTLVELIIVIAIIAILAAIAIPKFGQIRGDANLKADIANAKSVATAVAQAVANGDATPTTDYTKYIDGGAAIKSKVDTTKTLTPSVDAGTGNITVKQGSAAGDKVLYPQS